MSAVAILFPGFAMFLLTFCVFCLLGFNRYRAVRKREIDARYFKLYRDYEEPERLRVLSRHVSNHFEVPLLFYIALIFIFITQKVDVVQVVLAWCYVVLRLFHAYIHLGSNKLTRRFTVFILSGAVLVAMWGWLFISLLIR